MATVRVVGADPSLRNFGIVVADIDLDTNQVTPVMLKLISPPKTDNVTKKSVRKNSDDLRRARWLQSGLIEATEEGCIAFVEMPVGSQSARAMASYGIVIGVLSSCKLPLIEVTPTEVKMAATGSKTASKAEMIEWATQRHPHPQWITRKVKGKSVFNACNEHIADALGCIYAGIETAQFKNATAMMRGMTS